MKLDFQAASGEVGREAEKSFFFFLYVGGKRAKFKRDLFATERVDLQQSRIKTRVGVFEVKIKYTYDKAFFCFVFFKSLESTLNFPFQF